MTDTIPPELIAMPEDVMILILEKCDFGSIECLRKTCHTLRNFIDDNKPKLSIDSIEIIHYSKKITVVYWSYVAWKKYPLGETIELTYQKIDEESTKIIWHRSDRDREKIIRNENYVDYFSRDFEYILACNLKILNVFRVICKWYKLKDIRRAFESSGSVPIKVQALLIEEPESVEDVLDVLPYLCCDTLDCLIIDGTTSATWDITKLMELEHWEKLNKLITSFTTCAEIQCFDHFENADLFFEKVTMDDVTKAKKNFLTSPSTTKRLSIFFNKFPDKNDLNESLGLPYEDPKNRKKQSCWFFRRSDTHVLWISLASHTIGFKIKTMEDVPQGAVVIG